MIDEVACSVYRYLSQRSVDDQSVAIESYHPVGHGAGGDGSGRPIQSGSDGQAHDGAPDQDPLVDGGFRVVPIR